MRLFPAWTYHRVPYAQVIDHVIQIFIGPLRIEFDWTIRKPPSQALRDTYRGLE